MSEIRITALPPAPVQSPRRTVELPMAAFERRRVRRRLQAPDGTEFLLELPTGTVLPVGDPLYIEGAVDGSVEGGTLYRIAAAPEEVLVVRPRSVAEGAFVGHLIGNLHRDVDIVESADGGGEVLALWDEPLERRLRAAGLDVQRATRPFRGRAPGEHSH